MTTLALNAGETHTEVVRWESDVVAYKAITSVSSSAPASVTAPGHGLKTGWRAAVETIRGPSDINAKNSPPRSSDYHSITSTDSAGASLSSGEHAELTRESGDTDAHPMLPFRGVLRPVPWEAPSGGAATLGRVDVRTRIAASAGGTCTVKMRWARLRGGRELDTISDPTVSRVLR